MKPWRWFVEQVERLRRSIVFALGSWRGRRPDDHITSADGTAPGPPAHWVERVRRGAPGLLEPSFRHRGERAEPPVTNGVAPSQAELEPEPLEGPEPVREHASPEPRVTSRREALVQALVRKVLRRKPSRSVPARAAADTPPAPGKDQVPREPDATMRRAVEPAEPPAREPDLRRLVSENGRAPAPPPVADELERSTRPPLAEEPERSPRPPVTDERERFLPPPVADERERSTRLPEADGPGGAPDQSEVVELEAPVLRRTARFGWAARPEPPSKAGVARPSAKTVLPAELAIDDLGNGRVWERALPPPAPRRASHLERLREPVFSRPASPQESSADPGPSPRRDAERLSAVDVHPWPELPPPLDQPDSEAEAALRAWEHQRRLDDEQTRL